MNYSTKWLTQIGLLSMAWTLLGQASCSDDTESKATPVGGYHQPCYPNDTCDDGFTCVDQICITDAEGGSGGSGGSTSNSGGAPGNDGGTAGAGGEAGADGPSVCEQFQAAASAAAKELDCAIEETTPFDNCNSVSQDGCGAEARAYYGCLADPSSQVEWECDSLGAPEPDEIFATGCDNEHTALFNCQNPPPPQVCLDLAARVQELAGTLGCSGAVDVQFCADEIRLDQCPDETSAIFACELSAAEESWSCPDGSLMLDLAACTTELQARDECHAQICTDLYDIAVTKGEELNCNGDPSLVREDCLDKFGEASQCADAANTHFSCLVESATWSCVDGVGAWPTGCDEERWAYETCIDVARTPPVCFAVEARVNQLLTDTGCNWATPFQSAPFHDDCTSQLRFCPSEGEAYMQCMTDAASGSWTCDGSDLTLNSGVCATEKQARGACLACLYDPTDTVEATLHVMTDDFFKVWVNGELIDDIQHPWTEPQTYVVNVFLRPSEANVIAIEASNIGTYENLDRGTVVGLTVPTPGGDAHLASDASWKVFSSAPDASWITTAFDDSSWPNAVPSIAFGDPPIGLGEYADLFPNASWIWSYLPVGAGKPDAETIYLRREFYVGSAQILDAPGACP